MGKTKESFILYTNYEEIFSLLSDEDLGKLMRIIMTYEKTQQNPDITQLEPTVQMAFMFIKGDLDRARVKYNTSINNGKKGGRPKKTDNKKPKQNPTKPKRNLDVDVDVDVDEDVDEKKKNTPKKKYGEYKNVLLTDSEIEKLITDYPNHQELIKFLDEYIEMKGYKAKSHYLAIKKWVVDAVGEKTKKKEVLPF